MKFIRINIILVLSSAITLAYIYSQDKKSGASEVKQQLNSILQNIEHTEKLVRDAKNKKVSSLKQMELINSQISYRNELLAAMKIEMANYQSEIRQANSDLEHQQALIRSLQKEYVQLLKKKLIHKVTFNSFVSLLNSDHIDTQIKRWYILQWVEKNMLQALQSLDTSQQILKNKQWELQIKTNKQDSLIKASAEETHCLQEDIKMGRELMAHFQNLESHLLRELVNYKKKKEEIAHIISGSIKSLGSAPDKLQFKNVNLKLVFPVDFPIITSRFGKNMESGNPNLIIRNNGIDLQSSSPFVKSAAQAEVIQIRKLPSSDYLVITKSGPYYLVYSNLQSVLLKEGEILNINSTIGKSGVNESGIFEVHFEVWEGSKPVDPLKFLK